MAGWDNGVCYGVNWDYRGLSPVVGQMTTDGQLMIGSTASPNARVGTLTSTDGSISISYSSPSSTTMAIDLSTSGTSDLHLPKYIVGDINNGANYPTINSAILAASSDGGGIVGIQDGTYTEDVTLVENVHLASLYTKPQNQGLGGVKILGKLSASFNGRCTITGLTLQTNDDYALSVTGASSTVIIKNCNFLCGSSFTNDIIEVTTGVLEVYESACTIIGGFVLFVQSGGRIEFFDFWDDEENRNTVANTISAGELRMTNCYIGRPISSSGTAIVTLEKVRIHPSGNTKALTCAGSGAHLIIGGSIQSGSSTSVTVTNNLTINGTSILANTAAAIDGAGSISHGGLSFRGTGSAITTTTQAVLPTDNISVLASNSGLTLSALVSNTSNTANSQATVGTVVAGGTAGDAYYSSTVTGGQAWTWGVDNSDLDSWALSANASLGTTNVIHVATTGEVNMPLQPAFLAFLGTTDTDVTGNAAAFTLGSGNALTEVYDIGGDFVTTGTFTAPVTGLYNLQMTANVTGLDATMTGSVYSIVTSNRTYQVLSENPFAATNLVGGGTGKTGSVLADMDAADTATFVVTVSGGVGNTADIRANSTTIYRTFVSGFLQS